MASGEVGEVSMRYDQNIFCLYVYMYGLISHTFLEERLLKYLSQ